MDADGSGAIGSDELSSAFKVAIIIHTFVCSMICLAFAVSLCYQDSRSLHASHASYVYKSLQVFCSYWVSRQRSQQSTR